MMLDRARSQFRKDITAVVAVFALIIFLLFSLLASVARHVPLTRALLIGIVASVEFGLYVGIPAWPIARKVQTGGDVRAKVVDAFTQVQYRLADEDATRMAFVPLGRTGAMSLNVFVEYDPVCATITGNWPTVRKVQRLLSE